MSKVQLRQVGMKKVGWRKVGWRQSDNTLDFPSGAILHFDADIDPYTEQTGGPHTFNHAVLSPQYQRNADGSYSNVGAKPAVDVFDGEKWLRSCGAVTNLLPSGDLTNWVKVAVTVSNEGLGVYRLTRVEGLGGYVFFDVNRIANQVYYHRVIAKAGGSGSVVRLSTVEDWTSFNLSSGVIESGTGSITHLGDGWYLCEAFKSRDVSGNATFRIGLVSGDIIVKEPQLTATAYPVPYVPPGVTQPASNATTTNGMWFSLPDGSELWKALDGQTDGVELVDLTSAIVTNYGGSIGSYDGETKTLSNTGIGTSDSYPRFSFEMGAKTVGARYRCSFVFSDAARVYGVRLASGGYTQSLTKTGNVFSGTITADNTQNKAEIHLDGRFIFSTQIISATIQRIQPKPLTLATRARMGVGSGDLANSSVLNVLTPDDVALRLLTIQKDGSGNLAAVLSDGTNSANVPLAAWARGDVLEFFPQVLTGSTQMRIGYKAFAATSITWGTAATYAGTFGPDATLKRLMIGYNAAQPQGINKLTIVPGQIADAEILGWWK